MISADELQSMDYIFTKNGWKNIKYTNNDYIYIKNNQFDEFRIETKEKYITIISPMPRSNYLYSKTFYNFTECCTYIKNHIMNYTEKMLL